MKFMLSLLAFGYVVLVSPTPSLPVHPGGIGGLFKGPNSETIIKGPDGSIITAAAEGGEVLTKLDPIVVAEPAIIEEVAPIAVESVPVAVEPAPVAIATPIEAVAVPAPVIESKQSSDLIGPSGRITTHGSQSIVAGPASTTITGPAVVAETVVKGAPIVAAPIAAIAPGAVTADSHAAIGPISVTAAPLAEIAPVSVTAAPILAETQPIRIAESLPAITSTITPGHRVLAASPLPAISTSARPILGDTIRGGDHSVLTSIPTNSVIVQGIGESSLNSGGPLVTDGLRGINEHGLAVTPIAPTAIPRAHGIANINDQIALSRSGIQLSPDQVAVDNRQIFLNPALIPNANIIPPEIGIRPQGNIHRARIPGEILTTPGLSSLASSTNIQRDEIDGSIAVTPNTLQVSSPRVLSPSQIYALQNQEPLINNQIPNIQTHEETPLNNQPQTSDPRLLISNPQTVNIRPRNEVLLAQNDPRQVSWQQIQQQELLNAQLAKSRIDPSQLRLTNVPLSAASQPLPLQFINPGNLKGGITPNGGLAPEAWGRYGRNTKDEKN